MHETNQYSKKELTKIVNSKISAGISEITNKSEKSETLQKVIRKASKLISSKLRKILKAELKTGVSQPVSETTPANEKNAGKQASKNRVVKKASKSAKVAKKASRNVKIAKKTAKKASSTTNIKEAEQLPLADA